MNKESKNGFTLVELLVVISIIALLLAILMPSLNKARQSAKSTICLSNLKQYEFATMMYFSDNGNRLFVYDSSVQKMTQPFELTEKYINNVNAIRFCPAINMPSKSEQSAASRPENFNVNFAKRPLSPSPQGGTVCWMQGSNKRAWLMNGEYSSYTFNGYLYTGAGATGFQSPSAVKPSASVPVYGDGVWPDSWPIQLSRINDPATVLEWGRVTFSGNDTIQRYITNRHGYKTNLAYFDGHVSTIKLKELWQQKWGPPFLPLSDVEVSKISNIRVILH